MSSPVMACILEKDGLCCTTIKAGREALPHWPELPGLDGGHPLQAVRKLVYRDGDTPWFRTEDLELLGEAARAAGVSRLPLSIYRPRKGWEDLELELS